MDALKYFRSLYPGDHCGKGDSIMALRDSFGPMYHGVSAYIESGDFRRLTRRFSDANGDDVYHVLVELLAGYFIAKNDFKPEYERQLHGKTPDWTGRDKNGSIAFIADVVSVHHCMAERNRTNAELAKTGMSSFSSFGEVEQGRLWDSINRKADAYRELANLLNAPLIIIAHGTFDSNLDEREVPDVVYHAEPKLFPLIPHVSGVGYIALKGHQEVRFTFHPNPNAIRPIILSPVNSSLPIQ